MPEQNNFTHIVMHSHTIACILDIIEEIVLLEEK